LGFGIKKLTDSLKMITITNIRIYPFDTSNIKGKVRAFADVEIDGCILIKGFKVIEMENGGIFIAYPAQKNKEGKFNDLVIPLNKEVEKILRDRIVEEFKKYRQ